MAGLPWILFSTTNPSKPVYPPYEFFAFTSPQIAYADFVLAVSYGFVAIFMPLNLADSGSFRLDLRISNNSSAASFSTWLSGSLPCGASLVIEAITLCTLWLGVGSFSGSGLGGGGGLAQVWSCGQAASVNVIFPLASVHLFMANADEGMANIKKMTDLSLFILQPNVGIQRLP